MLMIYDSQFDNIFIIENRYRKDKIFEQRCYFGIIVQMANSTERYRRIIKVDASCHLEDTLD